MTHIDPEQPSSATEILRAVKGVSKALLAGAIAGVAVVAAGYTDDNLTRAEVWTAIGAGLTALAGVYGIGDGRKSDTPSDREV